jgi:hypothetical protein
MGIVDEEENLCDPATVSDLATKPRPEAERSLCSGRAIVRSFVLLLLSRKV